MIDGKYDVVKSLYDDSFTQYDVGGQNTNISDPFKIHVSNFPSPALKNFTQALNFLVPEGLRDVLALDANKEARFCVGINQGLNYKGWDQFKCE